MWEWLKLLITADLIFRHWTRSFDTREPDVQKCKPSVHSLAVCCSWWAEVSKHLHLHILCLHMFNFKTPTPTLWGWLISLGPWTLQDAPILPSWINFLCLRSKLTGTPSETWIVAIYGRYTDLIYPSVIHASHITSDLQQNPVVQWCLFQVTAATLRWSLNNKLSDCWQAVFLSLPAISNQGLH